MRKPFFQLWLVFLAVAICQNSICLASTAVEKSSNHFRNEHDQFDPVEIQDTTSSVFSIVTNAIKAHDKLQYLASYYAQLSYVPYVWGGENIASKDVCLDCRKCVQDKRYPLKSRLNRCSACQQCGIDCSHLVHKIFNQAGLEYPYASTKDLKLMHKTTAANLYNLVDVGTDVRAAQPGDLIVYGKHVVMALKIRANGHADFIHATRFGSTKHLGGIYLERDRHLVNFRGKIKRILRHRHFFANPFESQPSMNTDLTQYPGASTFSHPYVLNDIPKSKNRSL